MKRKRLQLFAAAAKTATLPNRRLTKKTLAQGLSKLRFYMEKLDTALSAYISVDISAEELGAKIADNPRLNFIHVDCSEAGKDQADSIILQARKNPTTKQKLVIMANAGFHLYVQRGGQSSLVRHRRISTLWQSVVNGDIKCDKNNVFYTIDPALGPGEPRLLVVFSSIAAKMYTPSLMRHFEQNFSTIRKYVPANTHILRIADMGGVVGSFYLNSNALPNNEENIYKRIANTAAELGVNNDAIVLYGTSKGGTAASFYAMRHGWRCVAVDPILSDAHYVKNHNDSHFTVGTFPATKQERFADLVQSPHAESKLSVVCSSRSPQYPYIADTLINQFRERFLFLNSENPEIRTHPDVGPKTISHALSQINLHLAGLEPDVGLKTVW